MKTETLILKKWLHTLIEANLSTNASERTALNIRIL